MSWSFVRRFFKEETRYLLKSASTRKSPSTLNFKEQTIKLTIQEIRDGHIREDELNTAYREYIADDVLRNAVKYAASGPAAGAFVEIPEHSINELHIWATKISQQKYFSEIYYLDPSTPWERFVWQLIKLMWNVAPGKFVLHSSCDFVEDISQVAKRTTEIAPIALTGTIANRVR
jgi:hypothetical protein